MTDWKCRKLQLFVEQLADIRSWTWLQKLTELYYIFLSFKPRICCREKFLFPVLWAASLCTGSPRIPVSSVNAFVYLVGQETLMDCWFCRTGLLNKSNASGLQRAPFSQYNIENPSWKEVGMFIWTWSGCEGNPLNLPVYCLCCILAHQIHKSSPVPGLIQASTSTSTNSTHSTHPPLTHSSGKHGSVEEKPLVSHNLFRN